MIWHYLPLQGSLADGPEVREWGGEWWGGDCVIIVLLNIIVQSHHNSDSLNSNACR